MLTFPLSITYSLLTHHLLQNEVDILRNNKLLAMGWDDDEMSSLSPMKSKKEEKGVGGSLAATAVLTNLLESEVDRAEKGKRDDNDDEASIVDSIISSKSGKRKTKKESGKIKIMVKKKKERRQPSPRRQSLEKKVEATTALKTKVAVKEDAKAAKVAAKEDAKAAKVAAKEDAKAAKVAAKEDAKAAKVAAKEDAKAAKVAAKEKAEAAKIAAKEDAQAAKASSPKQSPPHKTVRPPSPSPLPLEVKTDSPGPNHGMVLKSLGPDYVIAMTNFKPRQRKEIEKLLLEAKATYTTHLDRKNTHLICNKEEGAKWEKAKKWGVECVEKEWLWEEQKKLKEKGKGCLIS